MMEVRLTQQMLTAVKETPELPDNLRARVSNAKADGDKFVLTLDQDERMAMTEVCEWYVRTNPDSGDLTEQGRLFDDIIQAIIDADLQADGRAE
jgi:hypothetical protein